MSRQFTSSESDFVDTGVQGASLANTSRRLFLFARVKVDSTSGHHCVIGSRNASTGGWYFYWNVTTTALTLQYIGGSGNTWQSNTFTPSVGSWETWGFHVDNALGDCTFWRNAELNTDAQASNSNNVSSGRNLYLGARNYSVGTDLFLDGEMADVCYWDSTSGSLLTEARRAFTALHDGHRSPVPLYGLTSTGRHWPLGGHYSQFNDIRNASSGTNNGTSEGAGPPIIYPSGPMVVNSTEAAGGGNAPLYKNHLHKMMSA